MPGARIVQLVAPPPALPAEVPDHVEAAPEAVPSAAAPEDVADAAKDKTHAPSVAKPVKAGK
jgi:hypothetical protein